MQKVTYTNILGESAVFCNAPPFIFASIDGIGPCEAVVTTLQGVYQGGDTTVGLRKKHREVDLSFSIDGGTREQMYARRQQLAKILAAWKAFDGASRARLIYENDHGAWWTWAIPETADKLTDRLACFLRNITITFRCESPVWYAMEPSSVLLAYSDAGFDLPFAFKIAFGSRDFSKTVQCGSHNHTPVVVTIEGQGETPSLVNHDTGVRLKLISALPAGSTLTINTDPAQLAATVVDTHGNTENAFGLLDVESPLTSFTLRPGSNRLEYEPGGAAALSRITVSWYDQYEGV